MSGLWCALPSYAQLQPAHLICSTSSCVGLRIHAFVSGVFLCVNCRNTLVLSTRLVGMQARDAELGAELLKLYRQGNVDSDKDFTSYLEKEREGYLRKPKG
jgi:hypothetical protein